MEDCTPLRRCTTCQKEYPATTEFFHSCKQGKYGLSSTCRTCHAEYQRKHYLKRKAQIHTPPDPYRICSLCGANLPIEEFHKNPIGPNGYNTHCRSCQSEYAKKYNNDPEHKRKVAQRSAAWYQENREVAREKRKEYYRKNKRGAALRWQKRKQKIKQAQGKYTRDDIALQIKAQTDKKGILHCWWCGDPINGKYDLDHRIPISRGGSNAPENLVIAHPECNGHKHDKMPWEVDGRLL